MASMKDVARIARVSIATVSRVLNDKTGSIPISKETRERVLAVVDKINYKPNYAAQRLRSHDLDHSIGIYVPWGWGVGTPSSFVAKLLEGAGKCIHDLPYSITLLFYEPGHVRTHYEELQRVRAHRLDAMMIVGASPPDIAFLETVADQRWPPLLLIHRELRVGNYVTADNRGAARSIVNHLLSKGHRRIALISTPRAHGDYTDYIYNERYLGYEDALTASGTALAENLVHIVGQDDRTAVYEAVAKLSALPDPPTAIFAARDSIVTATLKALKSHQLRIPDDVAVVGFSDNEEMSLITDPTTTLAVAPVEEMTRAGVNHLIQVVEQGPTPSPIQERFDFKIIYGESS